MTNKEIFLDAYIVCMLWSTSGTDQHGEEVESLEGFELSDEAKEKAMIDCDSFMDQHWELLSETPADYGYDQAGHDFWLTRNGHGAGFWDRGLGEIGEQLTTAAQEIGQCDPYIGDDGKIYF